MVFTSLKEPGMISSEDKFEGTMVTESLLNFVDLAGSEKVSSHYLT